MDKIEINKFIKKSKIKIIKNPMGDILKVINSKDKFYEGFGEAYFSIIKKNKIKGWKYHKKMISNLVVPSGKVKFVFYFPKNNYFHEEVIGIKDYNIITINPKIWFGFKGLNNGLNLILNFSNILHDDKEVLSRPLNEINYSWK